MPLLNKKQFKKNSIPPGLKDTDRVFYCEVTDEIFDNYQEFAERIILCNSLVWACEETGKSGLTYNEAIESERNVQKLLNDFPAELRKPVLYLVNLTNRSALNDMTDEIFNYVRERFFVGEILEVNLIGDHWVVCRVLQITTPTSKELADLKNTVKSNDKQFWPPGSVYHYEVELLEKSECSNNVFHVFGSKLRRKKSTYTKDRNHMFIKHFVLKIEGVWKLKPNVFKQYEINKINFDQIFAGSPPKFQRIESPKKNLKKIQSTPIKSSPNKNGLLNKAKKQESIDKYLKPKIPDKEQKNPKRPVNLNDKKTRESITKDSKNKQVKKSSEKRKNAEEIIERELTEKRRKMMEHQQQLIEKKQQKLLDVQRKKDEKKKLEEFVKEWNKTREDLELEDLRELPTPIPIHLDTPNEYFGQIAMLYEFFQTFSEQVNVKNFFPAGISIDLIDRALSRHELAGPLADIIHLLLIAIFKLQEDEEDEIGESYDLFSINEFDNFEIDADSSETKLASIAVNWAPAFQGISLQKLPIDATTITEVLRLHLLTSGHRVSEICNRWRIQEKGGYTSADDPGYSFRITNQHIIQSLAEKNISYLSISDKLAILDCLTNQITLFASIRDIIHDSLKTYRYKQIELRLVSAAELKKEKELTQKKKEKKSDKPNEKPEENEQISKEAIEKLEREIQRKKEDVRKQLTDLTTENMKIQLAPLGVDRAYRRYWLFPSISGIFIEDNEEHPPPCLPRGTPSPNVLLMKEKDTLSYIKKLFQKEYNKENLGDRIVSSMNSPKKNNGIRLNNTGIALSDLGVKEEPNIVPLTCWGNNDICPIHCPSVPRVRWSYYHTESEYEQLLNSLNVRGKRESKLVNSLTQLRDTILRNLSRPFLKLNKTLCEKDENTNEIRKSSRGNPNYDNTMFDFEENTDIEVVLGALLRNAILDIEEKSNAGGLGILRVTDRNQWIEKLFNDDYDKLCEKLNWGLTVDSIDDSNNENKNQNPKNKKYLNLNVFDILNKYSCVASDKIRQLSCAILQLEQSIELQYLKPPLGMERTKGINIIETTNTLKRWEYSLMKSTSFAQLFLHLCTLDNSIAWNRSARNANCRICRRRGDPENMLLCDICNKGHHIYCLKPKLTKIPTGDWFCHYCKPPPKEVRQKKKHIYSVESDDDMADRRNPLPIEKMELSIKGKCTVCGEKSPTIGCSKCDKRYHLLCLIPPLRKLPTVNWSCHSCRRLSAKKDEANELEPSCVEPIRSSRRKTSKAANEKIYRFVKQLRRLNSSDDEQYEEEDGSEVVNGRRRRTRHSLEPNYVRQLPLDNASLQEMLEKIMRHENAWPFLRPVTRSEAADYYEIIKRPMDFATIKHKLNMLEYHTNSQVISDSMLVFNNCFFYNSEGTEVHKCGVRLLEYFKKICREMNFEKDLIDAENQANRLSVENEQINVTNEAEMEEEEELEETVEEEEEEEEVDDEEENEVDEDGEGLEEEEYEEEKMMNGDLEEMDEIKIDENSDDETSVPKKRKSNCQY